jgi:hypothetical protein
MIDVARLGPCLRVSAALTLVTVLVDVTLQRLGPTPVLVWLPDRVAGNGYLEDSRQRLAMASEEYEEGRVDRDHYICAIVGLSSTREGIDLRVLAQEAGANCRCLGLAGAGASMGDLAQHAEALLSSSVRPDLVLIGVGPQLMIDPGPKRGNQKPKAPPMRRRLDLRHALLAIRNGSWLYSRRLDVTLGVESAVLEARARLFGALHVRIKEPEDSARSPWRPMTREMGKEHYSDATLREELAAFESAGGFDPQTYARSTKAPATLVRLIKQFRDRGAVVVILILPEHSWLRRRMPASIAQAVRKSLLEAFPAGAPAVVDLSDALGDDDFVDVFHANTKGSVALSRLVGARLAAQLPNHAPLMKTQN